MVKNMNEEELYKLRNKVFHKLLEFDDEFQNRVSNNINNDKEELKRVKTIYNLYIK